MARRFLFTHIGREARDWRDRQGQAPMPRWRRLRERLLQFGHPFAVAVRTADQGDCCAPDKRERDAVPGRWALQLDLGSVDRRQNLDVRFYGLVAQPP
jgi:hypothetical protein